MVLTLRQLRYFAATAKSGNMTRAAEELHIAPPALSVQVKAMEEALGVQLLHRHSRGVNPTPEGALLYQQAELILDMVERTEQMVQPDFPVPQPHLRFGMLSSALRNVGADAVSTAEARLPGIDLFLTSGPSHSLAQALEVRDLDIIFVSGLRPMHDIQSTDLIEERLVFATSPSASKGSRRVALGEVLASDLVFFVDGGFIHRSIETSALANGLSLKSPRFVGSVDVIRQMLKRGNCTAVMPVSAIRAEVMSGEIAIHDIEDSKLVRRLSLAWHKDQVEEPPLRAVINFAIEFIASAYVEAVPYTRLLST